MVKELDALVPKAGAVVQLQMYGGGPDESEMIGTSEGYLRFGIELMKGAFSEPDPRVPSSIQVDLSYLLHPQSNVAFDYFERRNPEDASSLKVPSQLRTFVGMAAIWGVLGFIAAMMVVGVVTTVRFMLG